MPATPAPFDSEVLLEHTACPVCGSTRCKPLVDGAKDMMTGAPGAFSYVSCLDCETAYLNPRPTLETIGRYYPSGTYWNGIAAQDWSEAECELFRQAAVKHGLETYQHLFDILEKDFPEAKGRMLDVGCGLGTAMALFQDQGWEVQGIELAPEPVAFANKVFDFTVDQGDLPSASYPEASFDLIAFCGVLEHLHEPRTILQMVHRLLKPGGVILIIVQNMGSLGFKLFGRHWYALDPPRHLLGFTPKSLASLLQRTGFESRRILHSLGIQNAFALKESLVYALRDCRRPDQAAAPDGEAPLPKVAPDKLAQALYYPLHSPSHERLLHLMGPLARLGVWMKRGEIITVIGKRV